MERRWNNELSELRRRQRQEYHDFVINFHDIESKRLLSAGEKENLMQLINNPTGFYNTHNTLTCQFHLYLD